MTKTQFLATIKSRGIEEWDQNEVAHLSYIEADGKWSNYYGKCRVWLKRFERRGIIIMTRKGPRGKAYFRTVDEERFNSILQAEIMAVPGGVTPATPPLPVAGGVPPQSPSASQSPRLDGRSVSKVGYASMPLRLHDGKWEVYLQNDADELRTLLGQEWERKPGNGFINYILRDLCIEGPLCATFQIIASKSGCKMLVQWLPIVISPIRLREKLEWLEQIGQAVISKLSKAYVLRSGLVKINYDHHFALTLEADDAERLRAKYTIGDTGKLKVDPDWSFDQSYLNELEKESGDRVMTLTDALERLPQIEERMAAMEAGFASMVKTEERMAAAMERFAENQARLFERLSGSQDNGKYIGGDEKDAKDSYV